MQRNLNATTAEVGIRGEPWLVLECGHKIRAATATKDDAGSPLTKQRCPYCSNGQSPHRRFVRPQEGEVRIIEGRQMWFWRDRWRPW